MSKIAKEIEARTSKLENGDTTTVEELFSEEEWQKIVELRLAGWLGSKVRRYSDSDSSTLLEFIGTRRRERFPRRMVALYRVCR